LFLAVFWVPSLAAWSGFYIKETYKNKAASRKRKRKRAAYKSSLYLCSDAMKQAEVVA
jgi:hypothetical protein